MGKSRRDIKFDSPPPRSRLIVGETPDYNRMPPIFSLERVQEGDHGFSNLNQAEKAAFAESIFKRRSLTWNEIQQSDRHGLGYEKISTASLKTSIPPFITEDQHNLLVFRFSGKKPMVGYRMQNIFYVLWFDRDFTLYDHG